MKVTVKQCRNKTCQKEFTPYNTLQKYCSSKCMKEMEGIKTIKKISDRRKGEMESYNLLRKAFLQRHVLCEVSFCRKPANQVHHKKGRIGSDYLDTTTWMATCSLHHKQIEENPAWAKEHGYSVSRLAKHGKRN